MAAAVPVTLITWLHFLRSLLHVLNNALYRSTGSSNGFSFAFLINIFAHKHLYTSPLLHSNIVFVQWDNALKTTLCRDTHSVAQVLCLGMADNWTTLTGT